MTQKTLGEKLEVAQNTISAWELGTREPDIQSMVDICGILGVSLDELLDNPNTPYLPTEERQKILEYSDFQKGMVAAFAQASPEELEKLNTMMKTFFPAMLETMIKANPDYAEGLQAMGEIAKRLQRLEGEQCQEQTPEPPKVPELSDSVKTDDGKPDTP